ncbi:MAG: GerW family sporulation protein [Lachnospiraceae bacterium]|nr:GerW family sporulation protein [Lachnospiraceae bacterium]
MTENTFNGTVEALFKGMDSFLTTKTVVGDAVKFDDGTIILPLVDVSFGVGAGAAAGNGKNSAGGGMGGKMTPSSVLVIQNGHTRLVNVKNQDAITKVLDMVPDIVDKFTKGKKEDSVNGEVEEKVTEILNGESAKTDTASAGTK